MAGNRKKMRRVKMDLDDLEYAIGDASWMAKGDAGIWPVSASQSRTS